MQRSFFHHFLVPRRKVWVKVLRKRHCMWHKIILFVIIIVVVVVVVVNRFVFRRVLREESEGKDEKKNGFDFGLEEFPTGEVLFCRVVGILL